MQSAVNFIREQLSKNEDIKWRGTDIDKILEQAKEIHKQEMIDFGNDLIAQNDSNYIGFPNLAEQYYNETYGSKGSDETKQ